MHSHPSSTARTKSASLTTSVEAPAEFEPQTVHSTPPSTARTALLQLWKLLLTENLRRCTLLPLLLLQLWKLLMGNLRLCILLRLLLLQLWKLLMGNLRLCTILHRLLPGLSLLSLLQLFVIVETTCWDFQQ